MLVLAIGKHSQNGKLKLVLQNETDDTPLQTKLKDLADQIGNVGTAAAVVTFICLLLHIIYDAHLTGDFANVLMDMDTVHKIVQAFIIAVSIIVVSVPEGLPLSVTIALAYSVGKMKE